MAQEIKILMVEDTPLDAELVEYEFKKEGIHIQLKRVETRETFEEALADFVPKVIFSDMRLPVFDGFSALAIAQERCPHVPFIIVSGKIGEEVAVNAVKSGATDYVFKHDLIKIVPATLRALKEFEHNAQLIENQRARDFLASVVESSLDSIIGLNFEDVITSWNNGAEQIYGYSSQEVIGKNISILKSLEKIEEFKGFLRKVKKGEYIKNFQRQRITKSGSIIDILSTISPVKDINGEIIGVSDITRDITASKKMQEELKEAHDKLELLSLTDPLTGLYNRRGLNTQAPQYLKMAKRNKQQIFLFFIDIDDMKSINDHLGHHEGDAVLVATAKILKKCFRETDIIARMGGDEFSVLVTMAKTGDEKVILERLQKLLDDRNAGCSLTQKPFFLSIGGIACNLQESDNLDGLLVQADRMMYIKKGSKKKIK